MYSVYRTKSSNTRKAVNLANLISAVNIYSERTKLYAVQWESLLSGSTLQEYPVRRTTKTFKHSPETFQCERYVGSDMNESNFIFYIGNGICKEKQIQEKQK